MSRPLVAEQWSDCMWTEWTDQSFLRAAATVRYQRLSKFLLKGAHPGEANYIKPYMHQNAW
jgi:hypothetical protein